MGHNCSSPKQQVSAAKTSVGLDTATAFKSDFPRISKLYLYSWVTVLEVLNHLCS